MDWVHRGTRVHVLFMSHGHSYFELGANQLFYFNIYTHIETPAAFSAKYFMSCLSLFAFNFVIDFFFHQFVLQIYEDSKKDDITCIIFFKSRTAG